MRIYPINFFFVSLVLIFRKWQILMTSSCSYLTMFGTVSVIPSLYELFIGEQNILYWEQIVLISIRIDVGEDSGQVLIGLRLTHILSLIYFKGADPHVNLN